MAIIYDWYENPNGSEEANGRLHPRPFLNGKVTTQYLANKIQERCSLTKADVNAVLDALCDVVGYELREGRQVHLEGLGFLIPTLKLKEPVDVRMNQRERNSKVQFKGVKFRMDAKLRDSIGNVRMEMSKQTRHSVMLTEEEIDGVLTRFFETHEVMTRREFQFACRMTQSTAILRLRNLRETGKLKNIGTQKQPIYVPMPGYYGK